MRNFNNLSPGCSISDIPGNRPEDEQWEAFIESFYQWLTPEQIEAIFCSKMEDIVLKKLMRQFILTMLISILLFTGGREQIL